MRSIISTTALAPGQNSSACTIISLLAIGFFLNTEDFADDIKKHISSFKAEVMDRGQAIFNKEFPGNPGVSVFELYNKPLNLPVTINLQHRKIEFKKELTEKDKKDLSKTLEDAIRGFDKFDTEREREENANNFLLQEAGIYEESLQALNKVFDFTDYINTGGDPKLAEKTERHVAPTLTLEGAISEVQKELAKLDNTGLLLTTSQQHAISITKKNETYYIFNSNTGILQRANQIQDVIKFLERGGFFQNISEILITDHTLIKPNQTSNAADPRKTHIAYADVSASSALPPAPANRYNVDADMTVKDQPYHPQNAHLFQHNEETYGAFFSTTPAAPAVDKHAGQNQSVVEGVPVYNSNRGEQSFEEELFKAEINRFLTVLSTYIKSKSPKEIKAQAAENLRVTLENMLSGGMQPEEILSWVENRKHELNNQTSCSTLFKATFRSELKLHYVKAIELAEEWIRLQRGVGYQQSDRKQTP